MRSTATIAQQNPNLLSGDIVIPEKVSYAKKVLQGDEWVTLEAYDYEVTDIFTSIINFNGDDRCYSSGAGAFQECAITRISLPATITIIPTKAFYGCQQLTSVTLPESITIIRAGAFANCNNLRKVTSLIKEPFRIEESFSSNSSAYLPEFMITLYVPKGCKALYNDVEGWWDFVNVEELESTAFKLTYMVDGEEYKTYDVEATTVITPKAEPVKEGFIFSGWSGLPSVMPAEDVVVTGTFTDDPDYTAVEEIRTGNATPAAYYSISGKKMNSTERGLNIIRMSDGTVRKVVVK